MSVFHFKRFDVLNEASSMKVNTDGALPGAATDIVPGDRHILDIGTGTGTIALMLAQRYSDLPESALLPEGHICGIDIDGPSALEAAFNFKASPWARMLEARHCSLRQYFPEHKLDLIVSNPPFFDDSLLPPLERKSLARHTVGPALSFAALVDFSCEYLKEDGRLSVILPSDQEKRSIRYAASCGLYLNSILRVRTTPKKAVMRIIMQFSRQRPEKPEEKLLTIQDYASYPENRNGYTADYLALTGDFYLK